MEWLLTFWKWPGRKVLLAVLAYKLVSFASVFCAVELFPSFNDSQYERVIHWPREAPPSLAAYFSTWDGAHYLFLSEVGYQKNSPSCAFYPLWPMLIRVASHLTFHNHFLAGILLANLLSLIGIVLFHHFVTLYHGRETANLSVVLLLAFPGALFFQFIYTEPLFFLLITLFFMFLFQKKYFWVAVVGFFLPLTKAIGIFCIFPLLWQLLFEKPLTADEKLETSNHQPKIRHSTFDIRHWSSLLGPLLGYFCYFLFMYCATGNPFAGFQAQRFYPNQPSIANIFNLPRFFQTLFMPLELHGMTDSVIDRGLFMLLLPCLYLIFKLNRAYFAYSVPVGLVPAMSSWFFSYNRNLMMCFPLFIVLADILKDRKMRFAFWYLVLLMGTIQVWFWWRHVNFQWAG
ncbi:MAG TPA: hypothetical protein VKQ08_06275 [Cyclobacteriaceae bacterium]|nr:hypothetical protein [Cyclobacteriaceae bacterium]